MCTEPLYAIRLKTQFDKKFQRFGIRTPIKILKSVKEIGKDISQLNYDKRYYDLLMISCGQCLQCRLQRVKQRTIMCMAETVDHKENSFITLTFDYHKLYKYYLKVRKLSPYLARKKAHFHEWSLEVEFFQKFMKRLRNWYYNYQLSNHLIQIGRSDLIPSTYPYVSHIRLPLLERPFLLKDFKPKNIRCMHCGEYGDRKQRPHHHAILFGFQFPDLEVYYENGKRYFRSNILSYLWPFGIHCIGDCTYNSCAYVSRYITKKINGNNMEEFYEGRKPEYVTYSTKPVLGANYFIKNYREFVNTNTVSVYASDKKHEVPIPKSYENILKKIDLKLFNKFKEDRVDNSKKSLDDILKQERSIYSKLDSNQKICTAVLRKLVRSFESSNIIDLPKFFKKAQAFGINVKFFSTDLRERTVNFLNSRTFKYHLPKNSNDDLHKQYYKFELARKRHISHCYNLHWSDERVERELNFYKSLPNPFKVVVRGRSLPDFESLNEYSCIDEKGKEYVL